MKHYYTAVSELVADIENGIPVHTPQGKVRKVELTDNGATSGAYVNLTVDRFGNFFTKVFKNFEHSLADFQTLIFRYKFDEIYVYRYVLENGTEYDYDVLVANAALYPGESEDIEYTALQQYTVGFTKEYTRIKWFESAKDDITYWNLTDNDQINILKSQWLLNPASTLDGTEKGTFNRGMIQSVTDTGQVVEFTMDNGYITTGEYWFSTEVQPTDLPTGMIDANPSNVLITDTGTVDAYGYYLYKLEVYAQGYLHLSIGNNVADTTQFKVRYYNDDPLRPLF